MTIVEIAGYTFFYLLGAVALLLGGVGFMSFVLRKTDGIVALAIMTRFALGFLILAAITGVFLLGRIS